MLKPPSTVPLPTAASGTWGIVAWARDERGRSPAREFFESLASGDKAKVLALFQRLAELGPEGMRNREKFKSLGTTRGQRLCEFKSHQIRFLGAYRGGHLFLLAYGLVKKKNELPVQALEAAARLLAAHDTATRGSR